MNHTPLQRQAVPAYFHPDDGAEDWATLAASDVALVVANVAGGPGVARDPAWVDALHAVQISGTHVVGYVDTGYLGFTGLSTRRGSTFLDDWLEQMLHDIDDWYALYGDVVTGIFFDQVTESEDGASIAPIFRRLRDHVYQQDADAITVLNPGVAVPAVFSDLADVLVTFEGPCSAYLARGGDDIFEPLAWQPGPEQVIWHIVHSTPAARAPEVVALSRRRGAALLYVTDGHGDNPYRSLPSDAVSAACEATDPSGSWFTGQLRASSINARPPDSLSEPLNGVDPEAMLINNPTLVRTQTTIEASADFVVASSSRRVFLASRRHNVPRWWTGSSPQIAADWLIENNRLYEYAGTGTDWNWRPIGQVQFEAMGDRARWCLEADLLGVGDEADATFHVSAPGQREYSDVAAARPAPDAADAELSSA